MRILIIILLFNIVSFKSNSANLTKLKLYIAVDGDDRNPGTLDRPFATFERAKAAIREARAESLISRGSIEVFLRSGTYYLDKPLQINGEDSGDFNLSITYRPYKKENVIISGGKIIRGWESVGNNLWKVNLPEVRDGKWYFRQLFANDKRKIRARSPNADDAEPHFITSGPLSEYAPLLKEWDFITRTTLFYNKAEAFCGFAFKEEDIKLWDDYKNAEVLTHHSWESSWQTIRKVDTEKNQVYFNTPSWCYVGFFGKESRHLRYRIENVRSALDKPGEWYLDKASGDLFYLAIPGENVKAMTFTAPVLEDLIVVTGSPNQPVQNITFNGLSFQHNNYPMGIYVNTIHIKGEGGKPLEVLDWPKLIKKQYPNWPSEFSPGYMEPQAAVYAGQMITIRDAKNIVLKNCQFSHTGNYGLYIANRTQNITVGGCHFFDMGAGGIKVGLPVKYVESEKLPIGDIPSKNRITNNLIHDIGLTIPGGVGIWLAQTADNVVTQNEIYNTPYSGISMGWTWSKANTYTRNNLIAYNNIHHVLQTITDGGGIYTLGQLNGSILKENYIHNIVRHPLAVGGDSQGIFFDESSQGAIVERNVITEVKNSIGFNGTKKENMIWKENFLDPKSALSSSAKKIIRTSGAEKGRK
jgi:hypothetical protein